MNLAATDMSWLQRTIGYFRGCASAFEENRELLRAAGFSDEQITEWRDRNLAQIDLLEQVAQNT